MAWWVVKKPGNPPIYWEHHPQYGPPLYVARRILDVCSIQRSTKMAIVEHPPKLTPVGKVGRAGIEVFIEAAL